MALEGTLKDFGLADIFQLIGMQKKTGVLTLRGETEVAHVLFRDGKIVYADSESKRIEDRLGTVLVKQGLLKEEQLAEALEKQKKTLRRLGHILVNDGYLTREKMQQALYQQVSQILYRLFRWKDGEYKFSQEETIDYDKENFVPIAPESILMEGMQMIDEWPIIEKKIRSFDMVFEKVEMGDGGIRVKEEPTDIEDDLDLDFLEEETGTAEEEGVISLSLQEAEIYDLVDGHRTVREITYRSRLNEFGTCRTLYDLLSRNLIAEVRAAAPQADKTRAASKAVAAPVREGRPFLSLLGYLVVISAVLFSLATFWRNPLNPSQWFGRARTPAARIGVNVSRLRMERLDYAIQVYELQNGTLPPALDALVEKKILGPRGLRDPWGRLYRYRTGDGDYTLTGTDASGQVHEDLIIDRPKSRSVQKGGGESSARDKK